MFQTKKKFYSDHHVLDEKYDLMKRIRQLNQHLCLSPAQESSKSVLDGFNDPSASIHPSESLIPAELLEKYERDGYFIIPGLIHKEEVDFYTARFYEIIKNSIEIEGMTKMKDVSLANAMKNEGRKNITGFQEVYKIQDWQNDKELMKYCKNEKILKYVKSLIGPNLRSVHTMVINKPTDLGTGTSKHPTHQDLLYFPIRPSNRIVASWTALEPVTRENGCLYVLPGSHKRGLFPHLKEDGDNAGYVGVRSDITEAMKKEFGVFEAYMQPGDTIFFHPCLLHGSGPNFSKGFRLAISCHYASGLCNFVKDLPEHNWPLIDEVFQKPLEKKFGKEKAKEIFGKFDKDMKLMFYRIVWKNKSRQLKGEEQKDWQLNEQDIELVSNFIPNIQSGSENQGGR